MEWSTTKKHPQINLVLRWISHHIMLNFPHTPALVTVVWITRLPPLLSNSHASIMAEARPECSGASACVNPNHVEPRCVCVCVCVWEIFCQELVNVPAGCCLHTFPAFTAACKSDCQWNQKISGYKKRKCLEMGKCCWAISGLDVPWRWTARWR